MSSVGDHVEWTVDELVLAYIVRDHVERAVDEIVLAYLALDDPEVRATSRDYLRARIRRSMLRGLRKLRITMEARGGEIPETHPADA